MLVRQPGHKEVEAANARFGADAAASTRPVLHQALEADQAQDLRIGCELDQARRGPVLIETAEESAAGEDVLEGGDLEVVVPQPGWARRGIHVAIIHAALPAEICGFPDCGCGSAIDGSACRGRRAECMR